MATMSELYQTVILDHNRSPRNFREMSGATGQAEGFNPLCGDKVHVWLKVGDDGRIEDVSFLGEGCAISKASSSIMTQTVKGRTVEEARALFEEFHDVVTGKSAGEARGKMAVFAGVSAFPMRVKCASLGWHALKAALEQPESVVSTE
ncbi:MAG TPA: SUF system NifU family Fe-S cluster assembly protein [Gemmatimonadales bacterium]|nr:SUF system NifU family Fe-S cluster assembly protein [Gemmatimonadales bacterium]